MKPQKTVACPFTDNQIEKLILSFAAARFPKSFTKQEAGELLAEAVAIKVMSFCIDEAIAGRMLVNMEQGEIAFEQGSEFLKRKGKSNDNFNKCGDAGYDLL